MLNGARNALLGYLYQLLGTASVQVREAREGDDAWVDLIARVGAGVVSVEEFGQDAKVRPLGLPNEGVAMIQFKYTAATSSPIERAELIDILCAFDKSRMAAVTDNVSTNRYVLITNRSLNANSQEIVEHGKVASVPHSGLTLKRIRAGEEIAENRKRLASYSDDPQIAATAWHTVLQTLDVHQGITLEGDLNRVRSFAASYGVLDTEWDARLNALIGALVLETAKGNSINISREWLKLHLVGNSKAANLRFGSDNRPHIVTLSRASLDRRVAIQHAGNEDQFLMREDQQNIRLQLASNTIVFVYGDGGCGKSLAVAQYLRSISEQQLVWSQSASTANETGIVADINSLRLPEHKGGGSDRYLVEIKSRLEIANPGLSPVWTIDLDGLDEAPSQYSELCRLIELCWAGGDRLRSPAFLVMTCRSLASGGRDVEQLVSKWLNVPNRDLIRGVGTVSVGEFVDQDLIDVARMLGGRPEQRIIRSLEQSAGIDQISRVTGMSPVAPDILQSLHHPAVWGRYALLPTGQREGVLDEHEPDLDHLAERFIERFLIRCVARREWSDRRMLEDALYAAAQSLTPTQPYSINHWEQGCRQVLGDAQARTLYNECLTYGLVHRESGSGWRWGHRFVVNYLARSTPRGANE